MDSRRFDQLARSLAASETSRRSVLGTLLAAAGALLLPRVGKADCIPPGKGCTSGDACCDGYSCFEAICDCPSGNFDAAGRCAPPTSGACASEGTACAEDADCCADAGLACLGGVCAPATVEVVCLAEGGACETNADCCIDDGLTCQEGVCLPAITVRVVCSDIGQPCGIDRVCCGVPATVCGLDNLCVCAKPLIPDRTGLTCVAICSYPDEPCSDDSPCCEGAGTCTEGICRCPDDLRPCGATCVDPKVKYRRDVKNCGARGNACGKDEVCCEGVCVAETAFATDPNHCGGGCTACYPEEICCDGVCAQPFADALRGGVCCAPEQVCAPGDGTELCCDPEQACHNGGCCDQDKVCGETCCDEFSICQCGECVAELKTSDGDGACCGERCVDGVCCPDAAICTGVDGTEFCCGIGHRCGPDPGTCASDYPTRTTYPVRTPTRPG